MSSKDEAYTGVVTKKDLFKVFMRSIPTESCWNYERQMNVAYCAALSPILKKLYPDKEELKEALERHLVFYNTTPYIITLPLGISAAMEEQRADNPEDFDTESITTVKSSLMGPLAGIGDSFYWGTLRIIATGIGTSLALQGNILGPILFFLIFNIPHIIIRYLMTFWGYKLGTGVMTKLMQSGAMDMLTKAAGIIGLMVTGAMSAEMVYLSIPVSIGSGETATTVQEILDGIIPGIVPLAAIGLIYFLLKKKMSPVALLVVCFIIGIVGAFFGVLA